MLTTPKVFHFMYINIIVCIFDFQCWRRLPQRNVQKRKKKIVYIELMMIGAFQMKPHQMCLGLGCLWFHWLLRSIFTLNFFVRRRFFVHFFFRNWIEQFSVSYNVHVINFFQFNKLFPFSFGWMSAEGLTVSSSLLLYIPIIRCKHYVYSIQFNTICLLAFADFHFHFGRINLLIIFCLLISFWYWRIMGWCSTRSFDW